MLLATFAHATPRVLTTENVLQLGDVIAQKRLVDHDPDPARPREAARVTAQTVADVQHGRGSGPSRGGPLLVGRRGPAVIVRQLRCEFAAATLQQQQACGGVTQTAAHGKDVAGLRPAAAYRLAAFARPQCCHRHHESCLLYTSDAADDL